jgi:hypothetical protein
MADPTTLPPSGRPSQNHLPLPIRACIFRSEVLNVNRLAILAAGLVLLAIGTTAFAQDATLATTTTKPVVDGVVNPKEYSFSKDFGDLQLYVSRTADALYVGVVGNSTGWVAFGLGSLKMDGADIFMGYVSSKGVVNFKPQVGRGHTHHDPTSTDINASIVSYAMKETGGKTTLEAQLKPDLYIKSGQSVLDMIYAVGTDDSFIPTHMFRGWITLKLQ